MRNLWLVAKNAYQSTVLRRAFILATLAIPVSIVLVSALAIFMVEGGRDQSPVGYVDHTGLLNESLQASLPGADRRTPIRAFPDEAAALEALKSGEIQAFFVIPKGYPATLSAELYTREGTLGSRAWGDFDAWLRLNLVAAYPAEVQTRLLEGPSVTVRDLTSGRLFSEGAVINIILPFVVAFLFFFATMMASGYMMEAVSSEKENRTVEVLLTSLTPGQLIAGKALGLLGAALTQLAVYLVAAVVGLVIAAPYVPELQVIEVPWGYLGMVGAFFLPAYILIGSIMIAIGGAVSEVQQGQQIAGMLSLVFMAPIFVLPLLFGNPSHPILLFLSFFPLTSYLTVSMRWGLGAVPVWQIALAWALLAASAAVALWAAVRVFRAGVLLYGQPLNLKTAWAAVKG